MISKSSVALGLDRLFRKTKRKYSVLNESSPVFRTVNHNFDLVFHFMIG